MRVASALTAAASQPTKENSPMTGPASTAVSTASGTSTTSTQVSSAEVMRPTCALPVAPARTGTTIPASAPPTTTSKTMLGIWLAVA